MKHHVLIVDDNREMALALSEYLEEHQYRTTVEHSAAAAVIRVKAGGVDAIVTDLRMEGADGLDLLAFVKAHDPNIPVLLMTAFGGIESAVESIKRGAYHYLAKPFQLEELRVFLGRAVEERELAAENRVLRAAVAERYSLSSLVGKSAPMQDLYEVIGRVARTDSLVLLTGESGTGKELVARALHYSGARAKRPFVTVNCTAIPAGLLESELFGHIKGAFTGATQSRDGVFVEADRGTLFLDEIGDMPLDSQSRLLRTLEDGLVRPVGGSQSHQVDVRVVAATNQNLKRLVQEKRFREDLYFRLNVIPIHLPPLRERTEDIPLLVEHFLERFVGRFSASPVRSVSPEAMRLLVEHPWPGNVRELQKTVERLVVLGTRERIEPEDMRFLDPGSSLRTEPGFSELMPLREIEDRYIRWVLERVGGNRIRASEILEVDPSTLYRRQKKKEDSV